MKCTAVQVSAIRLAAHEGCRRRFGTLTYAPMGLSCVLATTCRPTVTVSATASPQLVVSHVVKKLSIVRAHSKETFVKGTTQRSNAASRTDRNVLS